MTSWLDIVWLYYSFVIDDFGFGSRSHGSSHSRPKSTFNNFGSSFFGFDDFDDLFHKHHNHR